MATDQRLLLVPTVMLLSDTYSTVPSSSGEIMNQYFMHHNYKFDRIKLSCVIFKNEGEHFCPSDTLCFFCRYCDAPVLCNKDKDKGLFICQQEFVVGYSKAPEKPQSRARPICHSHAMTRMGREPATIRTAAYGARHATHCTTGDDDYK